MTVAELKDLLDIFSPNLEVEAAQFNTDVGGTHSTTSIDRAYVGYSRWDEKDETNRPMVLILA